MDIPERTPREMVAAIMMAGTQEQNDALDALLSMVAAIDSEWGSCMSDDWFREHPEEMDGQALAILKAVAR